MEKNEMWCERISLDCRLYRLLPYPPFCIYQQNYYFFAYPVRNAMKEFHFFFPLPLNGFSSCILPGHDYYMHESQRRKLHIYTTDHFPGHIFCCNGTVNIIFIFSVLSCTAGACTSIISACIPIFLGVDKCRCRTSMHKIEWFNCMCLRFHNAISRMWKRSPFANKWNGIMRISQASRGAWRNGAVPFIHLLYFMNKISNIRSRPEHTHTHTQPSSEVIVGNVVLLTERRIIFTYFILNKNTNFWGDIKMVSVSNHLDAHQFMRYLARSCFVHIGRRKQEKHLFPSIDFTVCASADGSFCGPLFFFFSIFQ